MPSRAAIGFTAIIVAALGALLEYFGSGAMAVDAGANGLRIGLILGLLWLAYNDLLRLPRWLLPALAVVVFAMLKFRWLLAIVPLVAALGWLLYPRPPKDRSAADRREMARKKSSSGPTAEDNTASLSILLVPEEPAGVHF